MSERAAPSEVSAKSKARGKGGMGCLLLFALPFAGVGVFMLYLMVGDIAEWVQARDWRATPAEVLELRLQSNSDGEGGTTYRVVARYRYRWQGETFESDRVSIYGGADNIGSFQKKLHRRLELARSKGNAVCYVNPDRPQQALLDRRLRWEMMLMFATFALVFGGAGFGMIAGGIYSVRRSGQEKVLVQENPEAPWLWRPEWAGGRIPSGGRGKMIGIGIFALFWNAISWPLVIIIFGEMSREAGWGIVLALLFPAIGLVLLAVFIRSCLQWKRFGASTFEMLSVPGVLGGRLAGIVHVPGQLRPDEGFLVTVRCKKEERRGSNDRKTETVLWQNERRVLRGLDAAGPGQTAIPVAFALPYDQPASSASDEDESVEWELSVRAAMPCVDFEADFEVPVFRTDESDPDYALDEAGMGDYIASRTPAETLAGVGVQVIETAHGRRLIFPMLRHKGATLGLAVFTLIWSGVCYAMWFVLDDIPLLFPIVFSLFLPLLFYGLLTTGFERREIEIEDGGLRLAGGILGLGGEKRIPFASIESVALQRGMQSGNQLYQSLQIVLKDGTKKTAVRGVEAGPPSEALLGLIEEARSQ